MNDSTSRSSLNFRVHSGVVIARRKATEHWLSPGVYISAAIGLFLAYIIISNYTKSIGSGGFNSSLNPVFDFIAGLLVSAFGEAFFLNTFSEGPFLFALMAAFVPILIHLTISSVFHFGMEKNIGVLRLIEFGPADDASYIIGTVLKDMFFYVLFLALLFCFFLFGAALNNFLLGPKFFFGLLTMLSFGLCISAYGVICSALSGNSASAVALFFSVMLVVIVVHLGSFLKVQGYFSELTTVLSSFIRWISPFFFWQQAMAAVDAAAWGRFILVIIGLLLLSLALLGGSYVIQRRREGG